MSEVDITHESPRRVRTVPVWAALALVAGGLVLVLAGMLLGYVEYTSPMAQFERQGRALLEQDLNGIVTEDGCSVDVEPYVDGGVSEEVAMQPATWLGIIAFVTGVSLLPYAIRHRHDAARVAAFGARPTPPSVTSTASSTSTPVSRQLIVWVVVIGVAGVAFMSVWAANWWSSRPESVKPAALPAGEHKGLSPFETPTDVDPDSRFVFEAEIPDSSGPVSEYWYATPTSSTQYFVNGEPVSAEEFGRSLDALPPMSADVVAQESGKLLRIDVQLPVDMPE